MIREPLEIVCVDDEPLMLVTYEEMIERQGYRVVTFDNSPKALEYVTGNSKKISLILCDYRMPDLSGLELKNNLIGEMKEIPFALISGFISRDKMNQISSDKVANFFAKPFNGDELELFVRNTHTDRVKSREEEILLIQSFSEEAGPKLDEIEDLFLSIETISLPQRKEALIAIGRNIHTIKGAAACVSLTAIAHFCHDIETSLVSLHDQSTILTEVVSGLLAAVSHMRLMIGEAPVKGDGIYDSSHWRDVLNARKQNLPVEQVRPTEQMAENQKISLELRDLNSFVETSGNLTILRNYLLQRIETLRERYPQDRDIQSVLEYMGEFQKENSMLQSRATDLKKVTFVEILRPLKKMVRDLSAKVQKKVQLVIEGEDSLVDYELGKSVGDALIHMIRNSLDHGVENPEERLACGKSEMATIKIGISIENDFLYIEVRDDGRGINADKVIAKLLDRGLVEEEVLRQKSKEDVLKWIFHPGFSTADSVSEISGRGIGMDMVKNMTQKFGGDVDLKSEIGVGTKFRLSFKLEKSANVKPAISFDIGASRIAVLCEDIIEIGNTKDLRSEGRLVSVGSRYFLYQQGRQLEVFRMDGFLYGKSSEMESMMAPPIVVSLKIKDILFSFFAMGTDLVEELLIKQLPKGLFSLSCISCLAVSGRNGLLVLLESNCIERIVAGDGKGGLAQ